MICPSQEAQQCDWPILSALDNSGGHLRLGGGDLQDHGSWVSPWLLSMQEALCAGIHSTGFLLDICPEKDGLLCEKRTHDSVLGHLLKEPLRVI